MKEQLLKILDETPGVPVSGARLGEMLGVSRNYVWKLIGQLQQEGIDICAVPQKGYYLPEGHPHLFPFAVQGYAKRSYQIRVLPTVTSTNQVVKELAEQGAPEGTVVLAESQTAGRGRQSRSFVSPKGSGIYLSVLLRPRKGMQDALRITAAAGVAVARAVQETLGLELKIKWVNDLYYQNKKVCGILSEGAVDLESGGLAYCVLGIGLNVYQPAGGFGELEHRVGALLAEKPVGACRARVAAAVLDRFFDLYEKLNDPEMMREYQRRSFLQGKTVTVVRGGEEFRCRVIGISDNAELLVQLKNGEERAFSSGEIKVEDYLE